MENGNRMLEQNGLRARFARAGVLLVAVLASWAATDVRAQAYIGFVYPAGGQRGTAFQVTLGGQQIDGVDRVYVSGSGVTARVVEYDKHMNPQEIQLLQEQLRELKTQPKTSCTSCHEARSGEMPRREVKALSKTAVSHSNLVERLEKIIGDYVQQPQCASIGNLVVAEVTVAKDAPPGEREIRVGTPRGLSNPMAFYVGQLPEYAGPPMPTSPKQILGKEAQSLRKRKPDKDKSAMAGMEAMQMSMSIGGPGAQSDVDDDEMCVRIPCTVNGQIASGSVDRFRFSAKRGQRVVVSVLARVLVPYMADAVPGWFQPVIAVCDAEGKEVAYNDDYRFKPDPVLFFDVPKDGEYVVAIYDAIFRGREDFVYRMTIGELPFITTVFPLGGQLGVPTVVDLGGVNLAETQWVLPLKDVLPGVQLLTAHGRNGVLSNPVPFAVDTLPDGLESEPNNTVKTAQDVTLPIIVNGTIGTPDDRDLFRFKGRAGEEIVAEVNARRLDSPLDSLLKITDAGGTCLAICDDFDDFGSGVNTHPADSVVHVKLPKDGAYYIHLSDCQHKGGVAYAYRLRISAPQPDFALRVVPSRVVMRSKDSAAVTVYAIRKDGYTGPIALDLKDRDSGFVLQCAPLVGTQTVARAVIRTTLKETPDPVSLVICGVASSGARKWSHDAVPAEDRMQAFLWRHLVPAQEFKAMVFNPSATAEKSGVKTKP